MMDFNEFQENILQTMKERTWGVDFDIRQVDKLQGQSYTGLSVRPDDGFVAASFNLDQFYGQMADGKTFDEIADLLVRQTAEVLSNMPEFDPDDLVNYDHMKQKLVVQVIPTERNQEMLQSIPHRNIEDMSLVYRVLVGQNEQGSSSFLVTNVMLENYGVTPEQLHHDAMDAAVVNQPATFRSLADVLRQLMGDEMYEMMGPAATGDGPQLYVASVEGGQNGAGVISYPDFMEQVSEQIGGDFFVLPSSIHEVLVLPDDGSMSRSDLENMVRDVNAAEVEPADQLSDNVYHYDCQDKVFELAASHEERMEAKKAGREYDAPNMASAKESASLKADASMAKNDMITVLFVEPDRYPETIRISNDLESLQKAVGGNIEVTCPYDSNIGLIMNEEGKINGLPLNRAVYDEDGRMTDIIAGTFLVAGLTGDGFCSLTSDQLQKFEQKFHQPETFIRMGRGMLAVPIPDEAVKEMDKELAKEPKEKLKPSRRQEVLS